MRNLYPGAATDLSASRYIYIRKALPRGVHSAYPVPLSLQDFDFFRRHKKK